LDTKKLEDMLLRIAEDFKEFLEKEAAFEGITEDEVQDIVRHFLS